MAVVVDVVVILSESCPIYHFEQVSGFQFGEGLLDNLHGGNGGCVRVWCVDDVLTRFREHWIWVAAISLHVHLISVPSYRAP